MRSRSVFIFNAESAHYNVRIFADCKKALHSIFIDPIIRIDKHHKSAAGYIKSCISRRRQSSVRLMYNLYTTVLLSPQIAHSRTIVRRAVINKNYLKIFVALSDNAPDALIKIFFNLINRHYHADKSILHIYLSFVQCYQSAFLSLAFLIPRIIKL